MSLFSCCPKKPKKSLDYVIKWVEDTDKTIKELDDSIKELEDWKDTVDENISELVAEAIEDYDWSNLPVEALSRKADKVEDAVQGDFAGLDENGNLIDSGYAPSAFAPATGSTEYAPASGSTNYAAANHSHAIIRSGEYGNAQAHVGTQVLTGDGGRAYVSVSKWIDGVLQLKQAFVKYDNIDNLARALNTPDNIPTEGSDNLVTSGGMKAALDSKRDLVGQTISLVVNGQETEIEPSDVPNLRRSLSDPDSTPTEGSDRLITSGAVYNNISKQAHLTIFKDVNHYPVDGELDVMRDLSNFLSNFESNKLYNCIITYRNLNTQRTNDFVGMCKWVFNGYDEQLDETIWTVYLYLGLTRFSTRCVVQGEVTEWDIDSWADWSYTSIELV